MCHQIAVSLNMQEPDLVTIFDRFTKFDSSPVDGGWEDLPEIVRIFTWVPGNLLTCATNLPINMLLRVIVWVRMEKDVFEPAFNSNAVPILDSPAFQVHLIPN